MDPPKHFHYHYIDLKLNLVDAIRDWIYTHQKSRFYIGETLGLDNNSFNIKLKIGFEEPKELSFFLLACPHLKYLNN